MIYLIQGVFYQHTMNLGIGFTRGGATAMFSEGVAQFMYSGVIWQPGSPSNVFEGHMQDQFGETELSEIRLSDTELYFHKRYLHRSHVIEYVFNHKEENTWTGQYHGVHVGGGITRCLLSLVSDDFFDQSSITSKLALSI